MLQPRGHLLLLHAVILMTAAVFVQSTNTTFQLELTRSQHSNIITLRCRNDGLPESGAVFYLNSSELNPENYPTFSNEDGQPGVVTFQIKRQLEGMYSCGIGEMKSNSKSLIAYPTSDGSIIRRKNTYFAVTGDRAVLQCAVSPGALIHYYRVTWQNGSRTLFRQSSPSQRNSTFPDSVDPRYQLDPMNLSLIIDDVRRSDSIQDYHCVLQVLDPSSQNTFVYMVASSVNISLTVLSPPVITTRPLQGTVSQRENAIFSCIAEGYPLPTISWMHNGRTVTDRHPDYLVSPNNHEGSLTVTSDLRILSASVDKTGDVTCIASASTPEDSGITLANHNASTSLTVLGLFKKFDVLISKGGDVIFLLELPAVYNQSVHLFIKYIDDSNSNRSYNRTTEIGFLNSKSIYYVEYSSQVSYDRFHLKAGLVSGGMLGPLTTAPRVYDKDSATLCVDEGFDIHHALVYGVTPAGFLFLVCIVLIIVICVLVCVITLKKDPHTPKLMYYLVKNAELDHGTQNQPEMLKGFTPQTADQFQSVTGTLAQRNLPPVGEDGVTAAKNQSGVPSHDQQPGIGGSHQVDTGTPKPPLSQQQSHQSQAAGTAMGTPAQRNLSIAGEDGITAADNSGTSSQAPDQHVRSRNGGTDEVDTAIPVPPLSQQLSSNIKSRSAHKGNPVYHLVKKSMKDAKFPERKYRRLKEELRSTCEKCKKEQ